jgi:hypothetical protein
MDRRVNILYLPPTMFASYKYVDITNYLKELITIKGYNDQLCTMVVEPMIHDEEMLLNIYDF